MDKFYFVGIKGSGMSSLANIMYDLGYVVEGSDKADYFFTEDSLRKKGITIYDYSIKNIDESFIYIKGNSVENEEVQFIRKNNYTMYSYNDFINVFFKGIKIGVAGTHGKTTTTMMVAHIMEKFYKTSYLVGDGTGVGVKDYTHFLFEACEYKNHFLKHDLDFAIITNVDFDHPDYFESLSDVQKSFDKFSMKAKTVIINANYEVQNKNTISFGIDIDSDVKCKIINKNELGYEIEIKSDEITNMVLPFFGEYMIMNFLAAFTICKEIGIPTTHIIKSIKTFELPKRRFTEYLINDQIVIDDYAHHPIEIKESLKAVRQKYPSKKIVLIFQPHTYSRTNSFKEDFKNALLNVEFLFIDSVFSSERESEKEENILIDLIEGSNHYSLLELEPFIGKNDYLLIFMGAGDINKEINKLYI